MKAIIYEKYGTPEVLEWKEVEKPSPKEYEVLIEIYATSVNSWDWDLLRGDLFNRLIFGGFTKPNLKILGADVAGKVSAIGKSVTKFIVGDDVFGDLCNSKWGAFAEYVCAHEDVLAKKPSNLSFEDAAALPQAGVMAYQCISDFKKLSIGEKVLINGAGGGVGTYLIQMAKAQGTEVTGVDSSEKMEMMRSLGADHVIDYKKEDFTTNGKSYDRIIDVVATRSIFEYKNSLNPNGILIMVGGKPGRIMQTMIIGPILSLFGNKKFGVLIHEPNKNLDKLADLLASTRVNSIIDQHYPLSNTAQALQRIGDGKVKGKLILKIKG